MDVSSVPGLAQAAAAVADAVKARDRQRLAELLADDVSIGDGDTRENFLATLGSGEWEELSRVIQVGYRRDGQRYLAPYTFGVSGSPPLRDDEMSVAVFAAGVRVRRGPATTSPILDTVSYAVVRRADDDRQGGWCKVLAADGTVGYIDNQYVSPIVISMIVELERRADGWKIVTIGYVGD
jgi:hypothetical protein